MEGDSLSENMEEDLVAGRVAIDRYREMARNFSAFETTMRKLLEEIQAEEEDPADDLADLLDQLPKRLKP